MATQSVLLTVQSTPMLQSITEKNVQIFKEKLAKKNEGSQNIYFSFVKHLTITVETSASFEHRLRSRKVISVLPAE